MISLYRPAALGWIKSMMYSKIVAFKRGQTTAERIGGGRGVCMTGSRLQPFRVDSDLSGPVINNDNESSKNFKKKIQMLCILCPRRIHAVRHQGADGEAGRRGALFARLRSGTPHCGFSPLRLPQLCSRRLVFFVLSVYARREGEMWEECDDWWGRILV